MGESAKQKVEDELSHGASRTPTTQGPTERSDLSWKQDMRSLIVSKADKNIKK